MRVLVLPRYSRLGASSRLRLMQYLPWLEAAGVDVTLAPLFSDAYVTGLQRNRRKFSDLAQAYVGRVKALLNSRSFDLVWIEKEVLPWLPAWVEQTLLSSNVPYVLDYDDAVFHYYDQHRNPLVRTLLGTKHPALMRGAALVFAGNAYLADFARKSGAPRVEIVPTVIDLDRYPIASYSSAKTNVAAPCVGWIGQRATASFLNPYKPLFTRLASAGEARFAAIGIDAPALGLPMTSIPWTEQSEVTSIASFDIGIMPLVDEPFERGKCGYKLIQYMACGLPVVASPVGVNRQIVEHGINGFLAETPQEWEQALLKLLTDPALRQRMGQAGREKVEHQYCIQQTGPRLARSLVAAATA
ncbi:glycosyltransferase family 4 protein [Glaciimonas sp. PCH181]|uniref:glycosyltransferase family 4 protein n=1 Tax=Glaciimonas sp. PCH181 TaxID=2133943 RepID=UPI000D3CC1EF|nr:glycosyltransferase family 4 protein [Glaciimonas sp. PCH181]PUA16913.1 glycosyl transferase family 1 [Glaciimonas sp. PCH181]